MQRTIIAAHVRAGALMHKKSHCWWLRAGPLLDLACKIFGTESAGVTIMDDRRMFIVEARGKMPLGRVNEDWSSGFCCWSTTGSHPSVLTVEDSHNDARCGCILLQKDKCRLADRASA